MHMPKSRNVVAAVVLIALLVGIALALAQDQETLRVRTTVAMDDPGFPLYLARLLGNPLSHGDGVAVHTNGENAFPAMLAAIDAAKRRISFETYIYDKGEVASRFTKAFEA